MNFKMKSYKDHTGIEAVIDIPATKIYCPKDKSQVGNAELFNTFMDTCVNPPTYIAPIIKVGTGMYYSREYREFIDIKVNSLMMGSKSEPLYVGFFEKVAEDDFDVLALPIVEVTILDSVTIAIKLFEVDAALGTYDTTTAQVQAMETINGIKVIYDKVVFEGYFTAEGISIEQFIVPLVALKIRGGDLIEFKLFPKNTANSPDDVVRFRTRKGYVSLSYLVTDFDGDNVFLEQ